MAPTIITLYKNNKDTVGRDIYVDGALDMISACQTAALQARIRSCEDKKERQALKGKLPAVTWSGRFSDGRAKEKLTAHSGIICLDIDDMDDLSELAAKVHGDPLMYAYFISPSGKGLKVLYLVKSAGPITWQRHEQLWAGLAEYFYVTNNVAPDESGKDVSRLCYIPADKDLFVCPKPFFMDEKRIDEWAAKRTIRLKEAQSKLGKKEEVLKNGPALFPLDEMDELYKFTSNVKTFAEGSRNDFIHTYACNANRRGIDQQRTLDYWAARGYGAEDIADKTIRNAYTRNAAQFGSFKKNHTRAAKVQYYHINGNQDKEAEEFDDEVKFWFEVENEKGKKEAKFSYRQCAEFLTRNGFYKYPQDEGYQLIHTMGRIIKIVRPREIREFILRYLKSHPDLEQVEEMIRRGSNIYLKDAFFEQLEYLEPEMKRDTRGECFIYFRNCYLRITADGIDRREYSMLDRCIWSKQIIDFNYEETDYVQGDFYKFVQLGMNGFLLSSEGPLYMEGDESPMVDDDEYKRSIERVRSIMSGIGYTLHGYKDPSETKAMIAVDRFKSSTGDANGRTGKSLLAKAYAKMINVCMLDGGNFRFDKEFAFQKANVDTRLLNFNDVLPGFDFSKLFGMITEEFSFEKKRQDQVTLPFRDSPKIYISTNHTLKGAGSSFEGRQFVVEFGNYFNTDRTPVAVFKKRFFDEWEESEYCRFYGFMIACIKGFMKSGLVDFPLQNYKERQLEQMAGESFIPFMDEAVSRIMAEAEGWKSTVPIEKKKLMEEFRPNALTDKLSASMWHKYLNAYAGLRGYTINRGHKEGRDRRDGIDYITFYK
jgi:hypothetical protein